MLTFSSLEGSLGETCKVKDYEPCGKKGPLDTGTGFTQCCPGLPVVPAVLGPCFCECFLSLSHHASPCPGPSGMRVVFGRCVPRVNPLGIVANVSRSLPIREAILGSLGFLQYSDSYHNSILHIADVLKILS